jgi:citrate lyase subunit beta/citryl-CoA lyase
MMPVNPFTATEATGRRPARARRSCLTVPGSDRRKLEAAAGAGADEILLDLEDGVAPGEKDAARRMVASALSDVDYGSSTVSVRVNGAATPWAHRDIIEIVEEGHGRLDCLVLPKVGHPGEVWFAEFLLLQLEASLGTERRIGLELQIESGAAVVNMAAVAEVTDRIEALVFGPGDYAADAGIWQPSLGILDRRYPGHQWHHVLSTIVATARWTGCDAVDGPYADHRDPEGFRESASLARLLGIDGKWCIHPSQVPIANEVFSTTPEEYRRAVEVTEAYARAAAAGLGAVSMEGTMVDEASRVMAERLIARGRAAGIG